MSGRRILFNSRGRVGVVDEDGTGERFLSFDVPNTAAWQAQHSFGDGRHAVFLSTKAGKVWEGNVPSRVWSYDVETGAFEELCTNARLAPFMPVAAVLTNGRLLVSPVIDGEQRVWSVERDGSDPVEITKKGEGFTYGVTVNPDGDRLAFHACGNEGYRVFTTRLDGSERTLVAGHPDHLYFGPRWSPDGQWLVYCDCHHRTDPGHDRADLCLGRPDGSEHRVATTGYRHWFATSYGTPETRGSGSNIPCWSPRHNAFIYTRTLPGSRTAWEYAPDRPDTDHFNRDYDPSKARGGTELCLTDLDGTATPITSPGERVWDFRATFSPEGDRIAFCRARVGKPSELRLMDADGANDRLLTRGWNGEGADHPIWL